MSLVVPPTKPSSVSPRLRRPALLASAGLIVAMAGVGAPLSASAAPAPAPVVTVVGTTMSPYGELEVTSVSGFGANDALTFALDGTDVTDQLVTTTTDSTGSIPFVLGNLHFPRATGGSVGSHTLTARDATANLTATVSLQVIPSPVATQTIVQRTVSQMKTTGVNVRFTGFLPGESVTFGMANQFGGSECGAPVIADSSGSATATCVWNAAYVTRFGSTPPAGTYTVGGSNSIFTINSDAAFVDVIDPTTPTPAPAPAPPAATPPAAAPAAPVVGKASFTG